MAEMTIRLITNPQTGKKDLIVSLSRDSDSLPHEHEELHRRLVNRILEGGLATPDELGQLVIEREQGSQTASPTPAANEPTREGLSQGE
jgi:hypothetical protein